MRNRGVFLDRDGTINREVRYLSRVSQFKLIDGASEAIRLLNESGYKVVVVTNQAGVARGYLSEQTLGDIHRTLQELLRVQEAYVDAIYYCPHHPTEGLGAYGVQCQCRKPKPGMLVRAAGDLRIDLRDSFMVGDKLSDLEAGYVVGCRTVLVRTGYGAEMERELMDHRFRPDYVALDLLDGARWILGQSS